MLVEPLIPSQFLSMIVLDREIPVLSAQAKKLLSFAEDLLYDQHVDRRMEIQHCLADLAAEANESEASKLLFAAHILESLWHLRMHEANSARSAWLRAQLISKSRSFELSKTVTLESLGLVEALINELDERLARYRGPCVWAK